MNAVLLMTMERFWARVDKTDGCWLWTGAKTHNGYGYVTGVRAERRTSLVAHRISYKALVGPIPEGLQLDHLCRVRNCVNPAHLEPVTNRENTLRGQSPFIVAHLTDTCLRGHSLLDAYVKPSTGNRECRVCAREARRLRRLTA